VLVVSNFYAVVQFIGKDKSNIILMSECTNNLMLTVNFSLY